MALFPSASKGKGGLENAALQQCQNVQRQFSHGKTDDAIDKAAELVAFVMDHIDRLDTPSGTTKEEASGELISLILAFVGLGEGEPIPPGAFTTEGAVVQCQGSTECQVITGTEFAGFIKPPGVGFLRDGQPYDGPVTFFIERLSDTADPFESFGFDDFPLFYFIGSIPEVTLTDEIGAGVCVVDPPDPLAPPDETIPFLRLAHIVDDEVDVTELGSAAFLDCSGASTGGPSLSVVGGRGLALAAPGALGGRISSFSPFGAVDSRTGGGNGTAPMLTVVSFPDTTFVDAGSDFQLGTFAFSDPDADVVEATVIETSDPNNTFTPDLEFTFDPDDLGDGFGQTSGTFTFGFSCPGPVDCLTGPVTFQMTLEDAAGNVSAPVSFSTIFVTSEGGGNGTAPTLTVVSFPDTTFVDAGSDFQLGTFAFSDPDADVVEATLIETSDPNNTFTPDLELMFDPDDFGDGFGQTGGTFTFGFGCLGPVDCLTGPVTFQMTLEDAAGNVSAPVSFSTIFVTSEGVIESTQSAPKSRPTPSPQSRSPIRTGNQQAAPRPSGVQHSRTGDR